MDSFTIMTIPKKKLGLYKETLPMKSVVRYLIVIGGILLIITGIWYFREIVVYILISGVLSIMGRPLVDLFDRIRIGRIIKQLGGDI